MNCFNCKDIMESRAQLYFNFKCSSCMIYISHHFYDKEPTLLITDKNCTPIKKITATNIKELERVYKLKTLW